MLPGFRQRLWIAAVVVVGALVWLWAGRGPLSSADGSVGISLMSADVSWPLAVGVALAAGLPAIAGAVVTAATGGPMAGVFSASAALTLLATLGGSGRGYLWRAALPGGYLHLIAEALVWALGLVALMGVIDRVRPWLRPRLPRAVVCEWHGEAGEDAVEPAGEAGQRGEAEESGEARRPGGPWQALLGRPGTSTLGAGVITAVIGGWLGHVLVRSVEVGQIVGGLALAFALAGLVTRLVLPRARVGGSLVAPLAVAIIAYAYVYGSYPSEAAVIGAMNTHQLTGLALALPIHYASAGVAGAAVGLGVGQGLNHSREAEAEQMTAGGGR